MPCVLPALAMKAVGVVDGNTNRAHARGSAVAYGAGVLASFLLVGFVIIGLRSAGHVVGWGAQLQQPLAVGVLACVLFTVGLSMSGVIEFSARFAGVGGGLAARRGLAGHFFTGVLAVIVASPCTAPFMGTALAYAFIAPVWHAGLVMLTLGAGLALPVVLIGLLPALGRLLPKPGVWMATFKRVLAFPMYLSAIWLVWVLANQRGPNAIALVLVAMLLIAVAAWFHGRPSTRGRGGRILTAALALAVMVPLHAVAQIPPQPRGMSAATPSNEVAFSAAALNGLRAAGMPIFVDIGADWCAVCKVNEHAVLDTQAFRNWLAKTGTVYMKGDYTEVDPEITAYLEIFHSPGVPMYVVYPRGGGSGRTLPTLLTPALVAKALHGK